MKLFYLISILILFNGCNAQTNNDSIPKEFEFINVFLPENLETIGYDEWHNNLINYGAIRNSKASIYPSKDISFKYVKELEDNLIIELEINTNETKDSISGFTLKINCNPTNFIFKNYQKDTLNEREYNMLLEFIDKSNNNIVLKQKVISNLILKNLKNQYPSLNQEPHFSKVEKGGSSSEKLLQWIITDKKGTIRMIDGLDKPNILINESIYEQYFDFYIRRNNAIINKTVYYNLTSLEYTINN
ncbi:MAG: hypothetical protein RQ875_08020 [Vicingaceae bacterium]|nr:hypothetical protein [Vicingaceae bacterium]